MAAADAQKGSAEMILLALREERARHGYELAKLVESESGNQLAGRGQVGRTRSVVSAALGGWMRCLLFEVRPLDPLVFGAGALLLAGIAMLACYLPARRATRVDLVIAFRQE